MDTKRLSSLSRLLGTTVKALQAVRMFKNLQKSVKRDQTEVNLVSDHQKAELLWVQMAQAGICDIKTLTK